MIGPKIANFFISPSIAGGHFSTAFSRVDLTFERPKCTDYIYFLNPGWTDGISSLLPLGIDLLRYVDFEPKSFSTSCTWNSWSNAGFSFYCLRSSIGKSTAPCMHRTVHSYFHLYVFHEVNPSVLLGHLHQCSVYLFQPSAHPKPRLNK